MTFNDYLDRKEESIRNLIDEIWKKNCLLKHEYNIITDTILCANNAVVASIIFLNKLINKDIYISDDNLFTVPLVIALKKMFEFK